ncbi:MAG: cysteine hydrolase [Clostridia bacterium]|nr:cysteine hydrolase [Clostridia bacterium]
MAHRKFLIVVDMQRDFIDMALGTKEAVEIVPRVAEKIRKRREEGYEIFATLDTHGPDYLGSHEGKLLPVVHCVRESEGWQLHPEVEEALGDGRRVEKPVFGSTALPGLLAEGLASEDSVSIELIGLCTDICVVSNALLLRAFFPEADIRVDSACCAGVTPERHEAALVTMAACQIEIA